MVAQRDSIPPYEEGEIVEDIFAKRAAVLEVGKVDKCCNVSCPCKGHHDSDTLDFILSNGVRVVTKRTDYQDDEVVLAATRWGGTSDSSIRDLPEHRCAVDTAYELEPCGVRPDVFSEFLLGRRVTLDTDIQKYRVSLTGSASPAEIELLLQLLHLQLVTQVRPQEEYLQMLREILTEKAAQRLNDPVTRFSEEVSRKLYGDLPFFRPIPVRRYQKLDFEVATEFWNKCMSAVQGYTFCLVGALPPDDQIKSLLERYVASIPPSGEVKTRKDVKPLFNSSIQQLERATRTSVRVRMVQPFS